MVNYINQIKLITINYKVIQKSRHEFLENGSSYQREIVRHYLRTSGERFLNVLSRLPQKNNFIINLIELKFLEMGWTKLNETSSDVENCIALHFLEISALLLEGKAEKLGT